MKAYRAAGCAITVPAWLAPWPEAWRAPMPIDVAQTAAVAGLARLDAALARRVAAQLDGAILRTPSGRARTEFRAWRAPRVRIPYDDTPAAALTLAHEVGHLAQMTDAAGRGRRAPVLAAAETGAQLVERLAAPILARHAPAAVFARVCDDALAMFARHPARDAYQQAGHAPAAWAPLAALYAPGHDWSAPPRRTGPAGAALAYGLAAALAAVLAAKPAAGLADWLQQGPQAELRDLAAFLPADLADPALYELAYDNACHDLTDPTA